MGNLLPGNTTIPGRPTLGSLRQIVERLKEFGELPETEDERIAVYLCELSRSGKQQKAMTAAGFEVVTLWRLRRDDDWFADMEQAALQASAFLLEDEALRRAVDGVDKDVYYKGDVVGTEKVYSDSLLIRLMAARNPEKFGDRTAIDMNADVKTTGDVTDVGSVSRLAALLDGVRKRKAVTLDHDETGGLA